MITNEKQYRSTKASIEKLAVAFATLEASTSDFPEVFAKAQRSALHSQIDELEEEVRFYEDLRAGKISEFSADSLHDLPDILIQARIARGMSQKDLGDFLGVAEQQIQRYESDRYRMASLDRLTEVADALNVRIVERAQLVGSPKLDSVDPSVWQAFPVAEMYIPVIRLDSNAAYRTAVGAANALMQTGVVLRCSLDEALDPDFDANLRAALQQLDVTIAECDVVLDLEAPSWDPQDVLINIVTAAIQASNAMATARSLILAGTSFPASMAEVTGPIQFWHRREWTFFRALLATLGETVRKPTFADYAIAANGYSQMDMRKVKPSATIRYACDDGWIIAKGVNVRDNGFGQYRGCSGTVTGSAHFLGSGFSPGSDYIEQCRDGIAGTGSLSTWRWVGSNHHITKVVADLATIFGALRVSRTVCERRRSGSLSTNIL